MSSPKPPKRSPKKLPPSTLDLYDFKALPAFKRQYPKRTRHVSARLYIDKYEEHREANEFLESHKDLHGDGSRTVVRALLLYRDVLAGRQAHPLAAPPPTNPRATASAASSASKRAVDGGGSGTPRGLEGAAGRLASLLGRAWRARRR